MLACACRTARGRCAASPPSSPSPPRRPPRPLMEINPYTALGVPPTASREEIKELFQTKTNDFLRLESLERLQLSDVILARSAYNLLMDESWRKAYDTSQKRKQEILDKQQRGIQDYINSLPDQAKRGRLEALMGEVPGVKSSNRDYGSSASSSASSTETLRDSSPPPPHGWWRSTSDERTTLFGHKQKTRAGSPWMLVFWLILLALFILPAIAALLVFLLKPTFHPPARLPPPLPLPVPYTRNIAIIGEFRLRGLALLTMCRRWASGHVRGIPLERTGRCRPYPG